MTLSIRWRDTEDRFAFSVDEQGRNSRFTLKRSGQEIDHGGGA